MHEHTNGLCGRAGVARIRAEVLALEHERSRVAAVGDTATARTTAGADDYLERAPRIPEAEDTRSSARRCIGGGVLPFPVAWSSLHMVKKSVSFFFGKRCIVRVVAFLVL